MGPQAKAIQMENSEQSYGEFPLLKELLMQGTVCQYKWLKQIIWWYSQPGLIQYWIHCNFKFFIWLFICLFIYKSIYLLICLVFVLFAFYWFCWFTLFWFYCFILGFIVFESLIIFTDCLIRCSLVFIGFVGFYVDYLLSIVCTYFFLFKKGMMSQVWLNGLFLS